MGTEPGVLARRCDHKLSRVWGGLAKHHKVSDAAWRSLDVGRTSVEMVELVEISPETFETQSSNCNITRQPRDYGAE